MEMTIKVSSVADAEHAIELLRAYLAFRPAGASIGHQLNPSRMAIRDLRLTARTENCLKAADIFWIDELVLKSAHQLLMLPNLGRNSLREITDTIRPYGLKLQS